MTIFRRIALVAAVFSPTPLLGFIVTPLSKYANSPTVVSASTVSSFAASSAIAKPSEEAVTIVGAGPSGLAAALQMLDLGYRVDIYDRLGEPKDPSDPSVWSAEAGGVEKFYLIGLGGRGQKALSDLGVWDSVSTYCSEVVGRKDWSPGSEEGVERIFTDRPYTTMVLPRDKLVGALYEEVLKRGGERVNIEFGKDVTVTAYGDGVSDNDKRCKIIVRDCYPVGKDADGVCEVAVEEVARECGLLIAADGAGRSVADGVGDVVKYVDDNVRIYKTIPLKLPKSPEWNWKLNFSARTADGRFNLDALPATAEGDYCAVMLLKETDPLAKEGADAEEMRADFDRILPQFSKLIDDDVMRRVAAKPVARLPSFRYLKRLNRGKVVVLGDAAHSVKPYFGLGANSALEDVVELGKQVKSHGLSAEAASSFNKERGGEAKALVKLSRGFDRPGALGFVSFILPLIFDGIFHGMAPSIFSPNTIAMLQASRKDADGNAIAYSFQEVVWIKRLDRLKQATLVGGFLGALTCAISASLRIVAKAVGKTKIEVSLASSMVLFLGVAVRRFYASFIDNSAGEVLAKTSTDINGKKVGKTGGIFEDNESMIMRQRSKQRERDGG